MIGLLSIILRLVIWFLLTSDLSPANIVIGVGIAVLLPHPKTDLGALQDWLRALKELLIAIPQAFIEAVELIFRPHQDEEITREKVKPRRTPGLVFLDIFLITFTPKSIVVRYHDKQNEKLRQAATEQEQSPMDESLGDWYEVHWVRRRK